MTVKLPDFRALEDALDSIENSRQKGPRKAATLDSTTDLMTEEEHAHLLSVLEAKGNNA
jgi:hypothetical protein